MTATLAFAHRAIRMPLLHVLLLLVATAMLAGTVSTGAELKYKSNLHSITADLERYQAATQQFQTAYNALPGDIINASHYWDECRHNIAECNGDGNGIINADIADNTPETVLAWNHLALAGLLDITYSGDLIGGYYVPGTNIPAAAYTESGYVLTHDIAYHLPQNADTHYLTLGGLSDLQFEKPVVPVADALALDEKLDDGIASTGKILAYGEANTHCLQDVSHEVLVGRGTAYYSTEDSAADGHCMVYSQVN